MYAEQLVQNRVKEYEERLRVANSQCQKYAAGMSRLQKEVDVLTETNEYLRELLRVRGNKQ